MGINVTNQTHEYHPNPRHIPPYEPKSLVSATDFLQTLTKLEAGQYRIETPIQFWNRTQKIFIVEIIQWCKSKLLLKRPNYNRTH
jgi:hypothetical protein